VILGIFAILSIIILPALSAASEEGRRTSCKSNLHAFGSAFGLFAADNDGWLPQHVGGNRTAMYGAPPGPTQGWYGHTIQRGGKLRNHGQLLTYLGDSSVFWCPSQTGSLTPPGVDPKSLERSVTEPFLATSDKEVQSEYLYRKEWYEEIEEMPPYRMATRLSENFTILADHFGEFGGVLAVTEGHGNGYNFLRLDGAIDYFKHPRRPDGNLEPTFSHKLGWSSESEWLAFDAYSGDMQKALAAWNP